MKKEYILGAIIGMLMLSYLLDAVVDPLPYNLATPYDFITQGYYSTHPFTAASVIIRSIAIFLVPIMLASFISGAYFAKGIGFLILSVLMQLYAVQTVITNAHTVTLEWALSISFGGAALLIPAVLYFLRGSMSSFHAGLKKTVASEALGGTPDWIDDNQE